MATFSRGCSVLYSRLSTPLSAPTALTLSTILGPLLLLNYDAHDFLDGVVTSQPSTGSDTAPLAGTGSARPVRSATALDGYPGITFDGVDDNLLVTFSAAIAAGKRPWVYLVAKMVTMQAGAGFLARMFTAVTAANDLALKYATTGTWQIDRVTGAGTVANLASGPADTVPHVFGLGFGADELTLSVDGAERATVTATGATDSTISRLRLGSDGGTNCANCVVSHVIVCADEPTWAQKLALNTYLRARWGLADTLLSTSEVFDISKVDPTLVDDSGGANLSTAESVGDGMYLFPWSSGHHNKVVKWTKALPFKDPASWVVKDLTPLGAQANGFSSACNDGQYIYLSPINNRLFRIDSATFPADASVTYKPLLEIPGTVGGTSGGCTYDGRYVYVVPLFSGDLRGHIVVRYDTLAGSYTNNASYTVFDIATVNAACCGYLGAGFDGRYVYFSPYANNSTPHGQFLRYDTTGLFTSAGSWETYDLTAKNAHLKGMNGIVCTDDHVYLVPGEETLDVGDGHVAARYIRGLSFTDPNSYETFDFATVRAGLAGFMFARQDSRYIYYPCEHTSGSCAVLRQDKQGSYTSAASYKVLDSRFLGIGSSGGFIGSGVSADGSVKVGCPAYHKYVLKIVGQAA